MGRSLSFGSSVNYLVALLGLAFASASENIPLTLQITLTRRIIMQKARGQPFPLRGIGLPQLASLRFQVLFHSHSWVLFNFPSRYLCTIGCQRVFSLGQWTGRILTRFHVSGNTWERFRFRQLCFIYRTITSYRGPFHGLRLHNCFVTERLLCKEVQKRPATPTPQRLQACMAWVWAFPFSIASTGGISSFSFPPGTEMFHFPGYGFNRL